MTPEDDQIARARGWYATLETGLSSLIDPKLVGALLQRIDSLEALATRLPAAHQPAAPAWGVSRDQIAKALQDAFLLSGKRGTTPLWDFYADAIVAALPPPAPGLDPEAVARVMALADALDPKNYRPGDDRSGAAALLASSDDLRAVCALAKARTIIAMAPPADASQSADMIAFGASDGAVYAYPGEDQAALREAFRAGAVHASQSAEVERVGLEWLPMSSAPRDGTLVWAYLYQTGVRLVRWWSPEECAADEGGDPGDYDGCWCEADGEDWRPRWWLPFEALPTPPAAEGG